MTLHDKTPGRLDLYVEKIVSYMNLDDAQRVDVVRELRSHLDEAIADGTARGMSQANAEEAAMERFGSPEMLAGRFGTLRGKGWIVFEAGAYALMIFVVTRFNIGTVSDRPDFITNTHIIIMSAVIASIVLCSRLWTRVQVNGTLRVYRFLRSTKVIPFDAITEVSMKPWHLVGPRRVRIKYSNGKRAEYSGGWPNARCVGIALEVLAPQTIQPRAAEFFRRLRLKGGQESLLIRVGLTAGWVGLAVGLALAFPLLWSGEGVSLLFGLVLLGSIILLIIQHYSHLDRAKRAVTILLTGAWFVYIMYFAGYAFFTLTGPRPLVLLIALLFPLPTVILWWRGKNRATLLAVVGVWLVATFFIVKFMPDNIKREPRSLGYVTGHTGNATWLSFPGVEKPVYATLGTESEPGKDSGQSTNFLALVHNGEAQDHVLESGQWRFIGGGPRNALLVRDIKHSETQPVSYSSEIYRMEPSGLLTKLTETSGTMNFSTAMAWPDVAVSPTGRYLLTSSVDSASTDSIYSTQKLAVVDLAEDKIIRYSNAKVGDAWRWSTSTTLEILQRSNLERSQSLSGKYEILELDAETGEYLHKRWVEIGEGNTLSSWRSETHAIIRGDSFFGMVDLNDGTSVSLPLPVEDNLSLTWNPRLSKVLYLGKEDNQNLLVVASPDDVRALAIEAHYELGAMDFAPDGKKAFMAIKRTDKYMFPLAQLVVADFSKENLIKIGRAPFLGTVLSFIADVSGAPHASVQWTPDSRLVIWPNFRPIYEEGEKAVLATEFLALDYMDR